MLPEAEHIVHHVARVDAHGTAPGVTRLTLLLILRHWLHWRRLWRWKVIVGAAAIGLGCPGLLPGWSANELAVVLPGSRLLLAGAAQRGRPETAGQGLIIVGVYAGDQQAEKRGENENLCASHTKVHYT